MPNDTRSVDRQDLDSMTREFLARGGKINHCPPGSSDNVVYKKGNFRRRPQAGSTPAQAQPGGQPAEGSQAAASSERSPAAPAPLAGDIAAE